MANSRTSATSIAAPTRSAKRPTPSAKNGTKRAAAPKAKLAANGLSAANGRSAQAAGPAPDDVWAPLVGLGLPAEALAAAQHDYLAEAGAIWNRMLQPPGEPAPLADRRFAGNAWAAQPSSAFFAELYLLNARTLTQLAESLEGDTKTKARIRFAVLQWIDAAAPSNYLALNPEAQKKAIDSRGESLVHGAAQLWNDARRGRVSQTDESAFEVGRNVATSAGSVVFENELFQLLEYAPLTAKVHERPMLFVPPCINKFYILDLQPENSLIRHTVAEGHRVFVVSWKNAGDEIAQRTWDDYIESAAIKAIGLVREITGQAQINTLGFCIGGTILATALAVLAARGERPAASMTLLTSFLDFSDTGILDIFIDEPAVRLREMTLGAESPGGGNLLKGQELATTFSFLRPNDLVWNYVVAGYLKGETPPPFDLLYWNGDGTNLPGPMYCWYLRNAYLENNLVVPGKVEVCGEPVDLGRIDLPSYLYASREDHIVPWRGAYQSTRVLQGRRRFVLGASGHIAGVINPPLKKKRSHWIGATPALPDAPDEWLAHAVEHPGSWWTDWSKWLAPFGGPQIAAPKKPGSAKYKPIEPAPGRYVKEKA
jgi:polyhydroxyalkanoate synthase